MNTFADLVAALEELDGALSLYATPRWRAAALAVAVRDPGDGTVPSAAAGMTFLCTVADARRIARQRAAWSPGRPSSIVELCEAIIYYAIYDEAQPPPSIFDRAPAA
jgi:hypothetical protein